MFARQFGPVLICLCLIQPSLVVPLLLTLPVVASEDMIKQNLWAGASMFVGEYVCGRGSLFGDFTNNFAN